MYLPLHIDLRGKKVLVVGFGRVGERRAHKLLKAGADVTVIDRNKVKVKRGMRSVQKFLQRDKVPSLKGYFLVVASTDDRALNEAICRKAKNDGCLINRADLFEDGNVIFPAVVKNGKGVISFTTFGRSPKLSKKIKEELEHGVSKY